MSSAGTKHSSPPFRADHVGSLLRPKKLFDARMAFDGTNLDTLTSGEGRSSPGLKPLEDEAIRDVVTLQERVGLKSVTDGECRRRTFHQDFLLGLEGTQLRYEASALKVDFVEAGAVALALLHFPNETIVAAKILFDQGTRYAGGRYVLWQRGTVELLDIAATGPGRCWANAAWRRAVGVRREISVDWLGQKPALPAPSIATRTNASQGSRTSGRNP